MKNSTRYLIFILSYFLNALGNALTVKGSVGAIVWTSTFENIGAYFGVTVGVATSVVSVIFYFVSKIVGRDFKLKDGMACVFLSYFFGMVIDFFLSIIGSSQSDVMLYNYIYCFAGVILISMSVSLAIHVDVAYLALDDFIKNLKTYIYKGNVLKATYTSLGTGLVLAIIFGILNGEIINLTILTAILSLSFGYLVEVFDIIFKFKHKENSEIIDGDL